MKNEIKTIDIAYLRRVRKLIFSIEVIFSIDAGVRKLNKLYAKALEGDLTSTKKFDASPEKINLRTRR